LNEAYKYIKTLESEHEEDIDPLKKNKIYNWRRKDISRSIIKSKWWSSESDYKQVNWINRMEEEINTKL
jgi:hypothetical protein